jgi:hypothetical protein
MAAVERSEAVAMLGEGLHTGLRKAADSDAADRAWQAIHDMPDGEWSAVVGFVVDGLGSMGVTLHDNAS